ncbi:nucleotidyltransferase domain-containing protein [Yoonia tamlensis]|nr:nucleotidyltransferase domain-containing protein [Yoonia tamlensis]
MSSDNYLRNVLTREQVDTGSFSPVRSIATTLTPMLNSWGNGYLLAIEPSGSFAKGTANKSSTDIDLFLTLSSSTPDTLAQIRSSLGNCLNHYGYQYRDQNVSLGVKVAGYQVDLVPGKRQSQYGSDHSLYRKKANTWTKTNIQTHIKLVRDSRRTEEIRVVKLWRDQWDLSFPSIYLELATLSALHGKPIGRLSENVADVLRFLSGRLTTTRIVDPANTNNVISDDLPISGKHAVATAARRALSGSWESLIR